MIIVHDIFICKPGNASKVAKMFKESMIGIGTPGAANVIMTDVTGQYNRVIMVSQFENLAAYEKSFEAYMNPSPEMKESMKKMEGYQDMYLSGSREIYKIW
jgi:heme-degrading monooxygenase HmoA